MFRPLLTLIGYLFTLAAVAGLLARYIPPNTFWPPAIIALLLPGLLLATAVFLIWVLLRRRWGVAVVPAIVVVWAFPLIPQLFAVNFGHSASVGESPTLSILTANMRQFINDDGEHLPPVASTFQFIAEAHPDILLMQELHLTRPVAKENAEVFKAVSGLPMRHQADLCTSATFGRGLEIVGEYYDTRPDVNGLIATDVETPLGKVRVINVHLESNNITDAAYDIGGAGGVRQDASRAKYMFRAYANAAAKRTEQAEIVNKLVRESPYPVIVGGDFNDVASSYTYRRSLTPRLQDAWVEAGNGLGTTFTGPIPGLRIDFLLVDTAFTVQLVERVETGFSDHRGLKAVLTKKP